MCCAYTRWGMSDFPIWHPPRQGSESQRGAYRKPPFNDIARMPGKPYYSGYVARHRPTCAVPASGGMRRVKGQSFTRQRGRSESRVLVMRSGLPPHVLCRSSSHHRLAEGQSSARHSAGVGGQSPAQASFKLCSFLFAEAILIQALNLLSSLILDVCPSQSSADCRLTYPSQLTNLALREARHPERSEHFLNGHIRPRQFTNELRG